MKLKLPLLALPLALFACEAPTTTPPSTARPLTPVEVRAATTRARTVLAPTFTEALRSLETSTLVQDLELDLPTGADVAREAQPTVDAIFSESSVESQTPSEITYRVPAQQVCGDDDCVRALTAHPVRLVASSNAQGNLHLVVLVGASRLRPMELDVSDDRIEADVDLFELGALASELAPELDLERASLPTVAEGHVNLSLGAHDLAIAGSARVEGSVEGAAYRVSLAESQVSFDLADATHTGVGEIALGALSVELPFAWVGSQTHCDEQLVCESTSPAGQLQLAAQGLSGRLHLDASTDTLTVDDLGIGGGPLTASLDGIRQASFDMNAAQGHSVDVSVRYLRQQLEISVSPSLEAVLELSMEAIADQIEVAAWAVRDTLRLRFDGASSPTLRIGLEDETVRVVSGALSLMSNHGALSAATDECIAGREDVAEDASFVEALMSFPCE